MAYFPASMGGGNSNNLGTYTSFDDTDTHTAQYDGYIVVRANASQIASAYLNGSSTGTFALFSKDQTSSVAYIKKGMKYKRRDSSSLGVYEYYPLID